MPATVPDDLDARMRSVIREEMERIGIFSSSDESLKNTQRNNSYLDRAADREEEDRANMVWVKAKRDAETEGRKEFRRGLMGKAGEWIIGLIGTVAAAMIGWSLGRGGH